PPADGRAVESPAARVSPSTPTTARSIGALSGGSRAASSKASGRTSSRRATIWLACVGRRPADAVEQGPPVGPSPPQRPSTCHRAGDVPRRSAAGRVRPVLLVLLVGVAEASPAPKDGALRALPAGTASAARRQLLALPRQGS